MLQRDEPKDYVLSTIETNTVRKHVELTFKELVVDITWEGEVENEVGKNSANGKEIIKVYKKYYKPPEVDLLIGDSTKAHKELGWKPKTKLNDLVNIMVDADQKKIQKELNSG